MQTFFECGFGNRWFLRTEVEREDGTEYELKGWVGPLNCQSLYLRVWFGKQVWILDSLGGLKHQVKKRLAVKIIFGIRNHPSSSMIGEKERRTKPLI